MMLGLTACSSSGDTPAEDTPSTSPTEVTPTESTSPEPATAPSPTEEPAPACESIDPAAAIGDGLSKIPPPFPGEADMPPWRDPLADSPEVAAKFDTCAPLEAVVLSVEGATTSSPMAIMLFHEGEYLGTATSENHMSTHARRIDDNTFAVQYNYPATGEPNALPSVATISTFTWDDAQEKVVWAGQVPGYDISDIPVPVEIFAYGTPLAVTNLFGAQVPATARVMEYHVPSEQPDFPYGDDPFFDIPQAGISSPDGSTVCNVYESTLICNTPGAEWQFDLGDGTRETTGTNILHPFGSTQLSPIGSDMVAGPWGPETRLKPGEARYFNDFVCMSASTDITCWEAIGGRGFSIDNGEFTEF